jgi:hypothetical protein
LNILNSLSNTQQGYPKTKLNTTTIKASKDLLSLISGIIIFIHGISLLQKSWIEDIKCSATLYIDDTEL